MDGIACFPGISTRVSVSSTLIRAMERSSATMTAAQHFVVVSAPVDRVYKQWSNPEDLPKFVPPLKDVCRIDDKHFSYRWASSSDEKGVLHIVLQIPRRRIAWRTMSNGFMSGVVSFEPRSQDETEVTLKIRSVFDPPSLTWRLEEYLGNFKRLVEREVSSS